MRTLTEAIAQCRSIGWFLEPIAQLAPFGKLPLQAVLRGITNDNVDMSVDAFKATTLPLMKVGGLRCVLVERIAHRLSLLQHFGIEEGLDFKVKKRGAPPLGGGEVYFMCPLVRQLSSIRLIEEGFIKRIR